MRPFNEGESAVNIIKSAVPDFAESEYPVFIEFLKAFASFLEQKRQTTNVTILPEFGQQPTTIAETTQVGGPFYESRKFFDYRDIETTLDEFVVHFLAMFGANFPLYSYIPKDQFVESLREFYTTKGTSDSFKWFFRVFFGTEADVYFPREDVLRASDGTWEAPITLKVSAAINDSNDNVAKFYIGQRVQTLTGTAIVENVLTAVVGQQFNQLIIVNEVYLKADSIQGTFTPGQTLVNIDVAYHVQTIILPVIDDLQIQTGGSNYAPGDLIFISEGPSGGGGYSALAKVAAVASTALNSVPVVDGGDGYIVGLPVQFVSTSGSGATAVVAEVIYGDWLNEDSSFILNEFQTPDQTDYVVLEDRNMIILELAIDPFCNAVSNVNISSPDYGADATVSQLDGTTIDTEIEVFLAASDEKPFMHPWVFTNPSETAATLANASVTIALTSNSFFVNTDQIFTLTNALDVGTDFGTAVVTANVIVSDISIGNNQDLLYLSDITPISKITESVMIKAAGTGITQAGLVTANGTSAIAGNNTLFSAVLKPNTHIRFADGTQSAVRSVVNNTFLFVYGTAPSQTEVAWSILPTGTITKLELQSQRFYGKIKSVQLLTQGHGYTSPPFVTADSIDAHTQEFFHLTPADDPIDVTDPSNTVDVTPVGTVHLFTEATLNVGRDAGQISKTTILKSGVNYLSPLDVSAVAVHGNNRVGGAAAFTAVIGALSYYPGSFSSSRGFLSADKFLQDITFYNDFVYVIKADVSVERYRSMVLKLLHPSGFSLVGRIVTINDQLQSNTTASIAYTLT